MIAQVILYLLCVSLMRKIWHFSGKFDQHLLLDRKTEITDGTVILVLYCESLMRYDFKNLLTICILQLTFAYIMTFHSRTSVRAVASLTVPGGQGFHFPHFLLKFQSIFLIFPQTLLIFFSSFWPFWWATRPPGKALATPLTSVLCW